MIYTQRNQMMSDDAIVEEHRAGEQRVLVEAQSNDVQKCAGCGTYHMGGPCNERTPTVDEQAGMDWWNGLTEGARGIWLKRSGGWSAADAWAYFRRYSAELTGGQVYAPQSQPACRVSPEYPCGSCDECRATLTAMLAALPRPVSVMLAEGRDPYAHEGPMAVEEVETIVTEIDNNPVAFAVRFLEQTRRIADQTRRIARLEATIDGEPHEKSLDEIRRSLKQLCDAAGIV